VRAGPRSELERPLYHGFLPYPTERQDKPRSVVGYGSTPGGRQKSRAGGAWSTIKGGESGVGREFGQVDLILCDPMRQKGRGLHRQIRKAGSAGDGPRSNKSRGPSISGGVKQGGAGGTASRGFRGSGGRARLPGRSLGPKVGPGAGRRWEQGVQGGPAGWGGGGGGGGRGVLKGRAVGFARKRRVRGGFFAVRRDAWDTPHCAFFEQIQLDGGRSCIGDTVFAWRSVEKRAFARGRKKGAGKLVLLSVPKERISFFLLFGAYYLRGGGTV